MLIVFFKLFIMFFSLFLLISLFYSKKYKKLTTKFDFFFFILIRILMKFKNVFIHVFKKLKQIDCFKTFLKNKYFIKLNNVVVFAKFLKFFSHVNFREIINEFDEIFMFYFFE